MSIFDDRVRESTGAVTMGLIPLYGAQPGYLPFLSAQTFQVGDTGIPIKVTNGDQWEIGLYKLEDGQHLTRQSISASSNGGLEVTFHRGHKDVICLASSRDGRRPVGASVDGAGLVGSDGKVYASGAFDFPVPGTVVASLAGDGTLSKASVNAGESAAIEMVNGVPMIKCVLSTTAGATFQADYTLATPVFVGYANSIQFPIKFSDMSATEISGPTIQVWMTVQGAAGTVRAQLTLQEQEPGLFVASFPRDGLVNTGTNTAPTTQFDIDVLTKITLIVTAGTSSVAKAPFWIGPVTANVSRRKGRVLIYMDGEYTSQQQFILPLLDRYGIKANLAITTAYIGTAGHMTVAQLDAAYAAGHTIIHHTFGPQTTGWDDAAAYPDQASIEADINAQWEFLRSRGWTRGIGHCVNGYTSVAFQQATPLARQLMIQAALNNTGMKTCRVGAPYSRAPGGVGQLFPMAHKSAAWRRINGGTLIGPTDTPATIQAIIDAAEQRGELACITMHRSVTNATTPSTLEMTNANVNAWVEYLADRCALGSLINSTVDSAYAAVGRQ